MSPILVRPVREQLEHDRIIRLLQTKFRRRYEAGINPGAEQNAAVGTGPGRLVDRMSAESGCEPAKEDLEQEYLRREPLVPDH